MTSRARPSFVLLSLLLPFAAFAQTKAAPAGDGGAPAAAPSREIALSPTRMELPMLPGTEKTVVINVISSGDASGGKSLRLLASLGDWDSNPAGDLSFSKPGSTKGSAAPWMIYSPVELSVAPGNSYPIRVTISVPKDAKPGDHRATLFIEERPPDIKTRVTKREVSVRFRLAAIFYIMVPPLTTKGSITALSATPIPEGVQVKATLKNEGNSHLRPWEGAQLVAADGGVIAETPNTEGGVVLATSDSIRTLIIPGPIPAGDHSVRYRVDFKDGSKLAEGRTSLKVP